MAVEIIPITLAHVVSYREAVDVVAREKRYLAAVEAWPLADTERFVRSNLERGVAQFVAWDRERVVGWADVVPLEVHAMAHRGSLGIGVLPAYRGRGVGRSLLRACIDRSLQNGLTRIELEVRTDNERAIRLYESLGFVREGVKCKGMRIEGAYFDTLIMGYLKQGVELGHPS